MSISMTSLHLNHLIFKAFSNFGYSHLCFLASLWARQRLYGQLNHWLCAGFWLARLRRFTLTFNELYKFLSVYLSLPPSLPPSLAEPLKFASRAAASQGGLSSFPSQPRSASFVTANNKQKNCRAFGMVDTIVRLVLGKLLRKWWCKSAMRDLRVGMQSCRKPRATRWCEMFMVSATGLLCWSSAPWPTKSPPQESSSRPSAPSWIMFICCALWWLRTMQKTISWKQSSEIIGLAEAGSG